MLVVLAGGVLVELVDHDRPQHVFVADPVRDSEQGRARGVLLPFIVPDRHL